MSLSIHVVQRDLVVYNPAWTALTRTINLIMYAMESPRQEECNSRCSTKATGISTHSMRIPEQTWWLVYIRAICYAAGCVIVLRPHDDDDQWHAAAASRTQRCQNVDRKTTMILVSLNPPYFPTSIAIIFNAISYCYAAEAQIRQIRSASSSA